MLYSKTKSDCFRIQNGDIDIPVNVNAPHPNVEQELEEE